MINQDDTKLTINTKDTEMLTAFNNDGAFYKWLLDEEPAQANKTPAPTPTLAPSPQSRP